MCTYHKERKFCAPHHNGSGRVGREGEKVEPVGCYVAVELVGWLALEGWRCLEKVVPYVWKLVLSSDLMKRLQYGCQQKLVNDFIMILLCFQHFQFYSTSWWQLCCQSTP